MLLARRSSLVVLAAIFAGCSPPQGAGVATTQPAGPLPSPSLSPAEVVKAVFLAMQHNDTPAPDAGITTAFHFASPGNRKFTGPLDHFIPMVKSPAFAALLNYKSADFSPVEIRGDEAQGFVKITTADDQTVVYRLLLSRQAEGEFAGCWMTDAVQPVESAPVAPVGPPQQGADDKGKLTI